MDNEILSKVFDVMLSRIKILEAKLKTLDKNTFEAKALIIRINEIGHLLDELGYVEPEVSNEELAKMIDEIDD